VAGAQAGPVGVGPHDVLGDADDVAHGDEAVVRIVLVVAGVGGVGAVVPHDPYVALGHGDVEGEVGRRPAGFEVVLMEFDAVNAQGAVPIGDDVVAGHTDDAFDEVVSRVLGEDADGDQEVLKGALQARGLLGHQPVVGIGEDDDVATVDVVGVEHRHRDAVALVEGVLHRPGGNGETLYDEGADEGDDRHSDNQVGQGDAPLLETGADPCRRRGWLGRPGTLHTRPTVIAAGVGRAVCRVVSHVLEVLVGSATHRPSPVCRVMTTSWASWPPTL